MFRSVFAVIAGLIATANASPAAIAAIDASVSDRVAQAQAKLAALEQVKVPGGATRDSAANSGETELAQWHNGGGWNPPQWHNGGGWNPPQWHNGGGQHQPQWNNHWRNGH